MSDNVKELIELIGKQNVFQKKYLQKMLHEELKDREITELSTLIGYFLESRSLEDIASAYLLFVEDTLQETKYFIENGCYRYSTFKEVAEKVYYENIYMEQYMLGLQISGYIWKNHLLIHRWFKNKVETFTGEKYLEIGPGHGQYFLEAVNLQKFQYYTGIEVSEKSKKLTLDWCERHRKKGRKNYELIVADFLQYPFIKKFDGVCMSEVLEHLEEPEKYLNKIYEVTNEGADIYISVPVNAPAVDHIYLFHNIEEVFDLVRRAGFLIKDSFCVTGNDISYEKAVKKKSAINLALHLTR